jgi:hypothetical protein
MAENIKLNKTVFDKTQYSNTIDTTFSELGATFTSDELVSQPTVEEFFSLYNQLFYNIPELGSLNSHQFLIQKSSDYINFDENNEIIEELSKEISQLRTELLDSQKRVVELETGTTLNTERSTPINGTNSNNSIASGNTTTSGGGGY